MKVSERDPGSRSAESTLLEVQIHPGTVGRPSRYFFLDQRRLRLGVLTMVGVMLLVGVGLAVLPWTVAGLLRAREYRAMLGERELQGQRAQALGAELLELEARADELRQRMERILMTYGMSADDVSGLGGFPFADAAPIDSIYSDVVQRARHSQSQIAEQLAVLATFVDEIETFERLHADQIRTTPSISPLAADAFVLTSPFGRRQSPFTKKLDLHPGLDMAAKPGTEIMAPADGVVVYAGRYPSRQSAAWWRYGNLVAIRHGERFITLFGHCDEIRNR